MGFRPDIEGLRAVAILLVVAYHARFPGVSGGFIGVDVFFVLSGYLITGLLAAELRRTGTVDFARFYARRARRLLPAASVVLLTTVVVGRLILSPIEATRLGQTALSTALYISNLYFIQQSTNYQAAASHDNPLLHTWSLAVEEQFYVLWPLLVVATVKSAGRGDSGRRLAWFLAAIGAVSFVASVIVTRAVQPWAFFGSPFRAWEFAFGGVAVLLPRPTGSVGALARSAGWIGLAAIVIGALSFGAFTSFPGVAALLPVAGTTLVLIACQPAPGAGVGRLLGARALQVIGKLSYSWYLWHWPVMVYAATLGLTGSLWHRLVWVAVSLGLSAAMFRFIENPIRHQRLLLSRSRLTLVLAASLTIVSAGISVIARFQAQRAAQSPQQLAYLQAAQAESAPEGCQRTYFDIEGVTCEFGDPRATSTVVIFGDSHATQWVPAFDRLGRERRWRIKLLSKSDCPSISVDLFSVVLRRRYSECQAWRDRVFAEVDALMPALVVVSNSQGYPGGRDSQARVSLAEWHEGTRRTIARLDRPGLQVVLIRDSPRPGFRVPECLSRAAFSPFTRLDPCRIDRSAALNQEVFDVEREAAAPFPRAVVLDLTEAFCNQSTCPPVLDGTVVYQDSNHMTKSFSASLAPALGRALDAAEQRSKRD
jgi:peptidoglycan/LPS O-acetylase OafA/YrhL